MIVIGGLKIGAIYSLAALGIVVIYKATRIVNFAHGAFVLAGAYATYGVVEGLGLGYWPTYVLVPIATGLLAAAIELAVLRPIRQADIFALITSTIFIGIGLSEVYRLVQNTEMLGVRNPVSGRPIFIGDVIITKEQIWVFAGAILSSLIGLAIFGYAPLGRGLRAMAANARGAVLCGYSIRRHECHGLVPRRSAWRARGHLCRAERRNFAGTRNLHDHRGLRCRGHRRV